jgi:hypothetical protein
MNKVLNSTPIFWDIKPCSLLKFKECYVLHAGFLFRLVLRPWRWRLHVPPKLWLTFNGLHGVVSQKISSLDNYRTRNLRFYNYWKFEFQTTNNILTERTTICFSSWTLPHGAGYVVKWAYSVIMSPLFYSIILSLSLLVQKNIILPEAYFVLVSVKTLK